MPIVWTPEKIAKLHDLFHALPEDAQGDFRQKLASGLDVGMGALIARLGREYRSGRLTPKKPCTTDPERRVRLPGVKRPPPKPKLKVRHGKPIPIPPTQKPQVTHAPAKVPVIKVLAPAPLPSPAKPVPSPKPRPRRPVDLDDPRYTPPPMTPWEPPVIDPTKPQPPAGRATTCQFPLWPHDEKPTRANPPRYCDAPSLLGMSYCREHCKITHHRLPRDVHWEGPPIYDAGHAGRTGRDANLHHPLGGLPKTSH